MDLPGVVRGRVVIEQVFVGRNADIQGLKMAQLRLECYGHADEHDGQNGLGDDTRFVEAHLETFADVSTDDLDGLEGGKQPGGKKSGQASRKKDDGGGKQPEHGAWVHAECHRNPFGANAVEIGNECPCE